MKGSVESNVLIDSAGVKHCWTRVHSMAPGDGLTPACLFVAWLDGEIYERDLVWLTQDRFVAGEPTCLMCLALQAAPNVTPSRARAAQELDDGNPEAKNDQVTCEEDQGTT